MIADPLQVLAHLAEMGTPPDDDDAVLRLSAGLRASFSKLRQGGGHDGCHSHTRMKRRVT